MRATIWMVSGVSLALAACGPRVEPRPIMENGAVVPSRSDEVVADARAAGAAEQDRLAEAGSAATSTALANCAPEICAAISRGEVAVGMTEAQVLAATRTTADAWAWRGGAAGRVMTNKVGAPSPGDAVGELAFVTLQGGRVHSYTYREAQGFRTVTSPADATTAGRAHALAETLLREGDTFTARGELDAALDRYDRADVLRPGHPETTLRIARTLDKQLRPLEALMRYRLFLHQLELEKIEAHGDAAAKLAEAIALARQRIIVLERHR